MNINLTLFGQTIAFAIFVWFTMKFVWPPITAAMQARQKKIAEGLDAAGRAQRDLQLAQEKLPRRSAKPRSRLPRSSTRRTRPPTRSSRKPSSRPVAKASVCLLSAKAEIEVEVNRAKDQLRAQVAALAVAGAEKILESSVDAKAHNDLVAKLASQL